MAHFEDLSLVCNSCGNPFTVPAGEQEWLFQKFAGDFQPPKRCRACRQRRKSEKQADNS